MLMYNQHEREQHLHHVGAAYQLSEKLKSFFQKQYCILTCSATAAIHSICIALKITNKRILTSEFHWPGAITPFLLNNNQIILGLTNVNFSLVPSEIKRFKPEIVFCVDYFGIAHSEQTLIATICRENNILYITDASSSMGAFNENNLPSGYFSDLIITSFGPHKHFYAGEGGAILTNSADYYENILLLIHHPYCHIAEGLDPNYFAMNFRMNPFGIAYLNDNFEEYQSTLSAIQKDGYEKYLKLKNDNILSETSPLYTQFNSTYQKLIVQTEFPEKLHKYGKFKKEQLVKLHSYKIPEYFHLGKICFSNINKHSVSYVYVCSNWEF